MFEGAKYLTPDTYVKLLKSSEELKSLMRIAEGIADKRVSANVIAKAKKAHDDLNARYGETLHADGSVLVKHPAIGYVTVEERLCNEPKHLFAASTRSLSTTIISLYATDALIKPDGSVSYINQNLLIEVEMTPMAFANLVASPGCGHMPATLLKTGGRDIQYEGDLSTIRGQLMFDMTQESTEGIAQWVEKIVEAAQNSSAKGGVMSRSARNEMDKNADTLLRWSEENPPFYAEILADFAANTTADVKMEVITAANVMGERNE